MFFPLCTRCYGRASTVLTSKKDFGAWGHIFGDEVTAAALTDCLLHRCHIVNIRGYNYRMRRHGNSPWRSNPLPVEDVVNFSPLGNRVVRVPGVPSYHPATVALLPMRARMKSLTFSMVIGMEMHVF